MMKCWDCNHEGYWWDEDGSPGDCPKCGSDFVQLRRPKELVEFYRKLDDWIRNSKSKAAAKMRKIWNDKRTKA